MKWALQRQLFYIFILVVFFAILGFLIGYPHFNKAPTCSDSKQNGTETGIDCGGLCARACIEALHPVSVIWSRAFRVVPGRYNAMAYLENKNPNVAVSKIKYRFRFSDRDNIYIGKRDGETFIPPAGKFAIFEPAVDVGSSIPVYTTFEFTEEPVWIQVPEEKINQLKVFVSNIKLEGETTSPKLFATIRNYSLFDIPEINVVVILYDALGNAVSASRTYLDELQGEESAEVSFTWPEPFSSGIVAKEIIPIFNVFSVKLK